MPPSKHSQKPSSVQMARLRQRLTLAASSRCMERRAAPCLLTENLGDHADPAVVPPRHDGAPRTAKYQEALDGGHDVLVLVSEVWGGFSPEAMRFLGELAQARGDRVDFERESATWSTTSFMSYHGQMLSLAVQLGVATEIQNSIKHRSSKD